MKCADGRVTFLDMSGMYERNGTLAEYISTKINVEWIDLRNARGTDGYCDDEAQDAIRRILRERGVSVKSVHYIDNGNYHYLSKLFLEMMDETFDLLVLDNHSDMQTPAFGDILSCGSWVKNVLDSNANVDSVYLCGVDGEKVDLKQIIKGTNPLYISIDKDVLSKHDYLTNWDQGSLRIDELETFLRDVTAHRNVCGVDVCGGINNFTGQGAASGLDFNIEETNLKTDIRIFEALGCY
jgi:hypothetical protein